MSQPTRTKTKISAITQAKKQAQAGQSLGNIFERLSALLSRHAPPFRFQDLGVKNKKSVQLVVPKLVAIPGA